MREILFRGKRPNTGEWVYGDLLHDGFDYDTAVWEQESKLVTEVDKSTIGQYTGLKDKNGKRIFEGDMLKPFDDEIDKMVAEFHHGAFMLCLYGDRGYRSESGEWECDGSNYGVIECEPLSSYGDDIEVIGNIHDTELLGGGEDG